MASSRGRGRKPRAVKWWWRCQREGRAQVERLIPIAKKLEKTASAGLSAKEQAVVKRALRRMYANLTNGSRRTR